MPQQNLISTTIGLDALRVGVSNYGLPLLSVIEPDLPSLYATYGSRQEVIDVGVSESSALGIALLAIFGQDRRPARVAIGRRPTEVSQIDTVTVVGIADGTYVHTIVDHTGVSTDFEYISAGALAAADIRSGLRAVVDADSRFTAADAAGATYTVTPQGYTGGAFSSTMSVSGGPLAGALTVETTTANVGLFEGLTAIRAAQVAAGTEAFWYATDLMHTDVGIYEGSRWALGQDGISFPPAVFMGQSNTANILDPAVTTDVFSRLRTAARIRTGAIWHALDTQYPDAAWGGRCLPVDPGAINWAWRVLWEVTGGSFSSTDVNTLMSSEAGCKRGNWVETMGRGPTIFDGVMFSGHYIDLIRGRDKLIGEVNAALIELQQTNDAVTFDDIDDVDNALLNAARKLEGKLIRKGSISVTGADLASIPEENLANRTLPARTLTAEIRSMITRMNVEGTLTVAITTA